MSVCSKDVSVRCSKDVSIDVAGLELPETLPGLKAWYDSRSDDYFTFSSGTRISGWFPRAGSLISVPLLQPTVAQQPLWVPSVAELGSRPAVQFDGSVNNIGAAVSSNWIFLHANTGATIYTIERVDSTGAADQTAYLTFTLANNTSGIHQYFRLASLSMTVGNSSGTSFQNVWANGAAEHLARDVSRWRAWSYGNGEQTSRVLGSTLVNADIGGQVPSTSNPLVGFRLGRGVSSLKGYFSQVLIFGRVLTTNDVDQLNGFFSREYGVAV